MVGRKAYRAGVPRQIGQPEGLLQIVEPAQEPQALGRTSNLITLLLSDAVCEELPNTARIIKHPQGSVTGAGQGAGGIDNALEDGGKV
jgi:hypothetical protein